MKALMLFVAVLSLHQSGFARGIKCYASASRAKCIKAYKATGGNDILEANSRICIAQSAVDYDSKRAAQRAALKKCRSYYNTDSSAIVRAVARSCRPAGCKPHDGYQW